MAPTGTSALPQSVMVWSNMCGKKWLRHQAHVRDVGHVHVVLREVRGVSLLVDAGKDVLEMLACVAELDIALGAR